MEQISIDEFKKIEVRVGEILSAEKVEGADKLLRLMVSFGPKALPVIAEGAELAPAAPAEGELEVRQIISGISAYFPDPQALVGVKCAFVTNLAPRVIRGLQSNGMILAAVDEATGAFSLLSSDPGLPAGSRAR